MAKRKNQGFNGGKNLVVYLGNSSSGDPRKEVIDISRKTWNEIKVAFLNRAKKKVTRINFEYRAKSCAWAGTWYDDTKVLKVLDNHLSSTQYYRQVIIHELAHAWYWNESKVNEDAISRFQQRVNELSPVNKYTEENRTSWGSWLYANEIHSAICEFLYAGASPTRGDGENYNDLLEAFHELHGGETR